MDQDIIKANLDTSSLSQKDDQIRELRHNIANKIIEAEELQIPIDEELVESSIVVFIEESIQGLGIGSKTILVGVEEYEGFKIISFNIGFESSYNNLQKILSNMVDSPWSNSIRDMKANKRKLDSINPLYDWDVEAFIEFYVLPMENNYKE